MIYLPDTKKFLRAMLNRKKQKRSGMKSKTKDVLEMLEQLFNGKYDPVDFSCSFPDLCFFNYEKLEKEYKGLGYYLDQVVPDICDEGKPGFDPTHMIEELKKVYEKVLELIKN